MILYHISTDLTKDGNFYPRIPEAMGLWEDNTTKRICVSASIEGCISAIPKSIGGVVSANNGVCKVFRIDTEKLGIPNVDIIDALELYTNDCVRDAEITKEHWIRSGFTVPYEDIFYIRINQYTWEKVTVIPSFIHLEAMDNEYENVQEYIDSEELHDELLIIAKLTSLTYDTTEEAFHHSFHFGGDGEFARFMEEYLCIHHPLLKKELVTSPRPLGQKDYILNVNFEGNSEDIRVFYLIFSQFGADNDSYRQEIA